MVSTSEIVDVCAWQPSKNHCQTSRIPDARELIQEDHSWSLCKLSQHCAHVCLMTGRWACLLLPSLDVGQYTLFTPVTSPALSRDCEFFFLVNLAATYESAEMERSPRLDRQVQPSRSMVRFTFNIVGKEFLSFASGSLWSRCWVFGKEETSCSDFPHFWSELHD